MNTKKIKISNVKNIESLEFELPSQGVYVLTGPNGSGKTTLLATLHRIGFSNAFANFFKTTSNDEKLDSFGHSSITYVFGSEEVTYRYGNTRWTPTPKSKSILLKKFGYPEVRFIAADAKRIEATQDELKANKIKTVDGNIRNDLSSILSNQKFEQLKYINTKRGPGNKAYLIAKKVKGKNIYFSEKNFSLGELCVLRLVTSLSTIKDQSLVLIDEIEMALHPRAQVALFNYLTRVADEKKLTIIFSTHSASLIKRAERNRILLLKKEKEGVFACMSNVYPAQVLGEVSYDEEINPDFLFFVEDYVAKYILEEMIERFKLISQDKVFFPFYKVIPVGGFKETIKFLSNTDQIFPEEVKRYSFLDKDVQDESIENAKERENYAFLEEIKRCKNNIKFLPCTPELGIIDLIHDNPEEHSETIKQKLREKNIIFDLKRVTDSAEYREIDSPKPRQKAKKQFEFIVNSLQKRAGWNEGNSEKTFAKYYVNMFYKNNEGELKKLLAPIF